MENRKGSAIFLGVIGVATLVVAIIGATFAFFSAQATSNTDAISAGGANIGLNFTDQTYSNLKTHLIPATETVATYAAVVQSGTGAAANQQCVDDNANEVCSVYEFTVTNPSTTTSQDITATLKVAQNTFTYLKYKVYEGSTATSANPRIANGAAPLVAATAMSTTTGHEDVLTLGTSGSTIVTLAPNTSKTYTIVIWINENDGDQNADQSQAFAAGLTISSGSGNGVTGVIALSAQAQASSGSE